MSNWDKQEHEPILAYEWFCRYRDMGPERSLSKVVQEYNRKKSYKSQLAKWSIKYAWSSRAADYDSHLESTLRSRKELDRQREIERTEIAHCLLADKAYGFALRKMDELENVDINPSQWKSIAEFAVKTKREALGMVGEKHEVNGEIEVIDKTAQRVSKEFLEKAERLLALRDGDDGNITS